MNVKPRRRVNVSGRGRSQGDRHECESTNKAGINDALLRVAIIAADIWALNEGPNARTKADYTRGIVQAAVMQLLDQGLVVPAEDVRERLEQGVSLEWRPRDAR